MKSWHDDDEFWTTFAPKLFDGLRLEKTPDETDAILSLLNIQAPADMLDLCCGQGRISLELARRGFRVTGVDRTVPYIASARKEAINNALDVSFVVGDMRTYRQYNAFDGIINVFTSFGYFRSEEQNKAVLDNIYACLKPGGKLLMDLIGKEILARIFRSRDWIEEQEQIFLEERRIAEDWSWIENRWIVIKGNVRKEYTLSHRIYSAVELKGLLAICGFVDIEVFGSFQSEPYDDKAKRLVVIARKPSDHTVLV
ncbi:class I SAM-dependent methyltransferase [bacterium]|nr:class I SAM-dependent methyltransferase [candidate division CSSED10-310 bacterium]